jgi:N-acylneuraminate cytidylyltransferase
MNIAIIPARGGSKRIPRKNIKMFHGRPMISWSIQAAQKSQLFERIIVSTDDMEIADVAKEFGAEVPFIRPKELADDYAGTVDVMVHACNWVLEKGWKVDNVCCIYATAPFIQAKDLEVALSELVTGKWAYVFPATSFPVPIFQAFKGLNVGGTEMFFPEYRETRTQDIEEAWYDVGQFYWGDISSWMSSKKFFKEDSKFIKIPRWRSQDIDTLEDWEFAEKLAIALNRS